MTRGEFMVSKSEDSGQFKTVEREIPATMMAPSTAFRYYFIVFMRLGNKYH